MRGRFKAVYGLALLITVIDQATKYWVVENIPRFISISIIPNFFNLVYVRNRGAAFGFLNDPDIEWQFWIFIGAALLAALIIHIMTATAKKNALLFTGLGCILGGAIGNLIDRIKDRSVVDFLDFYIKDYHWPAFNVADVAICLGAFFVLLVMYKEK